MKLIDPGWFGQRGGRYGGRCRQLPSSSPRWGSAWHLVAVLVCAWAVSACAPPTHVVSPDDERYGMREEATAARAVIAQLRDSSYAAEAALDLQRAESWLAAVEQRLADGDDDEQTQLLMQAARTQLSAVKSYFAKREAEQALARVRGKTESDAE
jgi:hypothetical protein